MRRVLLGAVVALTLPAVALTLPAVALAQTAEDVQRAIDDGRVIVVDQDQMDAIRRDAPPAYDTGQLRRQMEGARMLEAHRREQDRERTQLRLVWAVLLLLGAGVAVIRALAKKGADSARSDSAAPDANDDDDGDDEDGDEQIEGRPDGPDVAAPEPRVDPRYDEELERLLDD